LVQLGALQPALRAVGVETLAVINTPVERARMYYRHRPTPVTLLSDPDCVSHREFGVPYGAFLPEGSTETPKWPYKATMELFMAARVNPTGELPGPTQPMEANPVLNAKDGFVMEEVDHTIAANHGTQLAGHFLVDAEGIVRWVQIEGLDDPNQLSTFPTPAELLAAASSLAR